MQDFLNQLKNVQKVENCRFNQHVTFHFWNWNLLFLHLPKNHFCLIRSWTGKFMVDKIQIFCINLKVPNDTNFFWATFFILYDPLELSTGACPTPSGTEIVKTHHCAVVHEGTKSKIWIPDFLSLICHFGYPQPIQHDEIETGPKLNLNLAFLIQFC